MSLNYLNEKIIVSSLPRTGSTLLWRSIVGDMKAKPSRYRDRVLRKLHIYRDELPQDYKCVFLFGDVANSIISTHIKGKDRFTVEHYLNQNNHFKNCGYEWDLKTEKDIFNEDFLNYEKIYDEWVGNTRYPTMCLRYEKLFDYQQELKSFLGIDFQLPPKKEREAGPDKISPEQLERLNSTYAGLINKINRSPDLYYLNRS